MPKQRQPREFALTVEVPEFDEAAAYNPERPISGLIRTQIHHLHVVEQHLPEKARTDININHLHSERQASEYIRQVTSLLHKHGKRPKTKGRKKPSAGKLSRKKSSKGSGKKLSRTKSVARTRK